MIVIFIFSMLGGCLNLYLGWQGCIANLIIGVIEIFLCGMIAMVKVNEIMKQGE